MAAPQGIYHSGSKDYLGDKATMLSSRWTQKQQNRSPRFKHEKRVLWFDFFNFFWDWGHFFIACLKNIICTKQYFCCLLLILPYQPKTRTESLILTKMHWQNLFLQHLKLGCASQNALTKSFFATAETGMCEPKCMKLGCVRCPLALFFSSFPLAASNWKFAADRAEQLHLS